MDTLDAKTRIMNEIDSIDVQVQAIQEKIAELHNRKNQYKDAYTAIVGAERQAERLLAGLLKAADVPESATVTSDDPVWEASQESPAIGPPAPPPNPNPIQLLNQDLSRSADRPVESQINEGFEDEPHTSEINGKRKGTRQIPSFLRQYL